MSGAAVVLPGAIVLALVVAGSAPSRPRRRCRPSVRQAFEPGPALSGLPLACGAVRKKLTIHMANMMISVATQ